MLLGNQDNAQSREEPHRYVPIAALPLAQVRDRTGPILGQSSTLKILLTHFKITYEVLRILC